MTTDQTQTSDTVTTGAPADTGTPITQASDTAPVSAPDDNGAKTYTQADIESAKRGILKQQQELQRQNEELQRKLQEHEEAKLSELERAQKRAEAAEEMAQQHKAKIAEFETLQRRNQAAATLSQLNVRNAEVIAHAIPDDILGDMEAVQAWAKDNNLIENPGGNMPGGRQGTARTSETQRNYNDIYRNPYKR